MKRIIVLLAMTFTMLAHAQNTPAVLTNFRIENDQSSRVYFDSSEPITGKSYNGFFISGKTITGLNIVSGSGSGHYFTVSSAFTFWDNNTIRYEGGSDTNIIEFTLSYIKNNIKEPEANSYRYVTILATGSGDGLTEEKAWTLQQAVSNATAGMTIWIKAGNYGNQNLSISKAGSPLTPIKFIGYKSKIGDITSNYFDYGVKFNSSEMPTFTGNNKDYGVAVWLTNSRYIVFRNIQMTNFQYGFRAATTGTPNQYILIDRYNGYLFGSANQENAASISFQTNGVNKKGVSTFVGNNHIRVLNSIFLNHTMISLALYGDGGCLVDNCRSYNDRTSKAERQDYHIAVNGDNNIIRNCHIENFNNTETNGSTHGIGIRGSTRLSNTYNLIEICTAVNSQEGLYIRNYGCDYNVIKNSVVRNNGAASFEDRGGVSIWGGSNFNTIESVLVQDVDFGIYFFDNAEEGNITDHTIGHDNLIRNCIVKNSKYAIYSQGNSSTQFSSLTNNKIVHCTFYNNQYFFKNYYTNVKNLEIINCNIINVKDALPSSNFSGFIFSHNNFFGSWGIESGIGNISF